MPIIQDFGEKIGGARKDMWKARGLITDDLTEMTDVERSTLVKKENIWLKPDWIKEIAEGTPQCVAYWQSKMRQAIPPMPPKADQQTQKNYVEVVSGIRDAVMAVRDPEKIDTFYEDFLRKTYFSPTSIYHRVVLPEANGIVTDRVVNAARTNRYRMQREAEKKMFGIPKNQQVYIAAKKRLSVLLYDGENVTVGPDRYLPTNTSLVIATDLGRTYRVLRKGSPFSDPAEWRKGTYFVFDDQKGRPLEINLQTKQAAQDYIEDYARAEQENENKASKEGTSTHSKERKKPFVPPQLQHLKRTGPDYRNQRHANSKHFLKGLGFRGGEFGNWLNQRDREANLDYGYDALRDLARILQIRPEDVSLNGSLAIAFGARGRGGRSAGAAHYEPGRQVINLTKMSGAGCLAHEWAHALDHAIGIANGFTGLASEQSLRNLPQSFKDLIRAMKHKKILIPPEIIAQEKAPEIENCKQNIKAWIDGEKPAQMPPDLEKTWDSIVNTILASASSFSGLEYMQRQSSSMQTKPEIEMLSQIRKSVVKYGLSKSAKQQIVLWSMELKKHEEVAKASEPQERLVETDYYKGSLAFDKKFTRMGHGYWSSECEMFARAFDCYIADKLKEAGVRSDYLSAYANSYTQSDDKGETVVAIPMGEERKIMNAHFDALLSDLKERGLLNEFIEARSMPLKEQPALASTRLSAPEPPVSSEQGRRVRYEQMSFEDMLFSAESRKQDTLPDGEPSRDHAR